MTFEELWSQVHGLPDEAKIQVSAALSQTIKKKLSRLLPEVVEKIVKESIEAVKHGSVETINDLVSAKMKT